MGLHLFSDVLILYALGLKEILPLDDSLRLEMRRNQSCFVLNSSFLESPLIIVFKSLEALQHAQEQIQTARDSHLIKLARLQKRAGQTSSIVATEVDIQTLGGPLLSEWSLFRPNGFLDDESLSRRSSMSSLTSTSTRHSLAAHWIPDSEVSTV